MTERSRFDRAWPSLLALVGTVAVVLALLWAFGSDIDPDRTNDDPVAENGQPPDDADAENEADEGEQSEPSQEESEPPAEPPADPVTAPPELRTTVGILNATSIAGLAAGAQQRFEEGGWSVPAIDSTGREMEATTVYYPDGLQESAEALRAQFPEIVRAEPTVEGLAQDRLIVILAQDYAEAVGDTG